MALIRRIARPMLASMFIVGGISQLRDPSAKAAKAGSLPTALAEKLPVKLPSDPVDLVRIDGAVKLVAGIALAANRFPRLSALTLAASLAPTTYAGHAFWREQDKAVRAQQRVEFFKNVSMLGGLIIAGFDTEGRPGLSWRAHHAAEHTAASGKRAAKSGRRAAMQAKHRVSDLLPD